MPKVVKSKVKVFVFSTLKSQILFSSSEINPNNQFLECDLSQVIINIQSNFLKVADVLFFCDLKQSRLKSPFQELDGVFFIFSLFCVKKCSVASEFKFFLF